MMNKLKFLREQSGMTQAELGRLLNVKDAAISKYESGKIPLTGETLLQLSKIFKVSIDYIMGNNDECSSTIVSSKEPQKYFFFFFDKLLKDVFISRLSTELEKKHFTVEDFSIASSLDINVCKLYLSGKQEPTLEDLITISHTFNVSVDYLIGQIDERTDTMLSAFKSLDTDNLDIIIGETKKLLKEQRYESVAADPMPLKKTGTDSPK